MQRFSKFFLILFYFCLTLFINNVDFLSYDYGNNISQQYYISQHNNKTGIINEKEEYYTIFNNINKSEIKNLQNKNNNYGYNGLSNSNNRNFYITNEEIYEFSYPVHLTHNICNSLENTIYTRAP